MAGSTPNTSKCQAGSTPNTSKVSSYRVTWFDIGGYRHAVVVQAAGREEAVSMVSNQHAGVDWVVSVEPVTAVAGGVLC